MRWVPGSVRIVEHPVRVYEGDPRTDFERGIVYEGHPRTLSEKSS